MIKNCLVCGTPFESFPASGRKYCSRTCMGIAKSKRIERICLTCGKAFFAPHQKVEAGFGLYCSRACADYGWDEPCQNCGKLVHRTPFHSRTQDHVFCSRKCYGQWKRRRIQVACQNCGRVFEGKQSDAADTRYCCLACYNQARAQKFTMLICQHCGKPFQRPAAFVNPNMYLGKYCSAECMGLSRRLPDSIRSDYDHQFTESLKEQIRNRDGRKCQVCGRAESQLSRSLDVHHIDYDKTNCHPDNLISLCGPCHSRTNYNRPRWKQRFMR